ncbi:MAG: hypothetical protein CMG00_04260 [Candidatus Marinimicrobia bacterium]|nr:hypothetical protein [Candidatus Neomarinimicrobiota bacterium]|tara:strand:- start:433 stop:771 length:339 start_codon:yes stop_codon:yes gene_type:complete
MILDVSKEMSPDGRFENYKWYIVESSEVWVKNRNNEFYSINEAIDWYERKDLNGYAPKDKFPDFIYEEIKNAMKLTFNQYSNIYDPDSIKMLISDYLDTKRNQIISNISVNK